VTAWATKNAPAPIRCAHRSRSPEWAVIFAGIRTRFEAKAFLSEALRFFDAVARRCVIDNTSVILAGGSGANALIAPEMEAFGELLGFEFMAHAIGHSDRKGRIERPFS
jgi:hypothetical protein